MKTARENKNPIRTPKSCRGEVVGPCWGDVAFIVFLRLEDRKPRCPYFKHGRKLTGRCGLLFRVEFGQNYAEGDPDDAVCDEDCCDRVGWIRFRHLRERSEEGFGARVGKRIEEQAQQKIRSSENSARECVTGLQRLEIWE